MLVLCHAVCHILALFSNDPAPPTTTLCVLCVTPCCSPPTTLMLRVWHGWNASWETSRAQWWQSHTTGGSPALSTAQHSKVHCAARVSVCGAIEQQDTLQLIGPFRYHPQGVSAA